MLASLSTAPTLYHHEIVILPFSHIFSDQNGNSHQNMTQIDQDAYLLGNSIVLYSLASDHQD